MELFQVLKDKMPPKYKHNMDLLMDLVQKNKLLEKNNPSYRKAIWEKITEKYNDANNSDFTKKQLSDRFQNYKRQLKDEKSNLKISQKKTGTWNSKIWKSVVLI